MANIDIRLREPGKGSGSSSPLPLTLAILPVLLVLLGDQPFALPLSLVREILLIEHGKLQEVGGKETLVVRGEILPVVSLAAAWLAAGCAAGVWGVDADGGAQLHSGGRQLAGRDDAVIKSLKTSSARRCWGHDPVEWPDRSDFDMKELLSDLGPRWNWMDAVAACAPWSSADPH